ncbi:PepSY-associated TM helix domain-containing protein [Chromatiaceae bacterium AAb-1]|nr:PepSY-associated TM helix domain-containing protein [Chromatiaceae bacterium AAb-1]
MNMMLLHRWAGLIFGGWLALVCLSGAILVYKNPLLSLLYPQLATVGPVADVSDWGPLVNQLQQDGRFRFVRLPSADAPWLEAVTSDKQHYYYDLQHGLLLVRDNYSDVFGWLYEFHLYLLAGETGRELLGICALAGILLMLTGLYRWWPTQWHWSLWRVPAWRNDLKTSRQWHTSFGSITLPLMLLCCVTGALLVYSRPVNTALFWLLAEQPVSSEVKYKAAVPLNEGDWQQALQVASQQWPGAELRLLSLRRQPADLFRFRIKGTEEWHPNGRSVVLIDPATYQVVIADNAAEFSIVQRAFNLVYPLHIGSVGGEIYRILLVIGGLIPLLLAVTGYIYYIQRRRRKGLQQPTAG